MRLGRIPLDGQLHIGGASGGGVAGEHQRHVALADGIAPPPGQITAGVIGRVTSVNHCPVLGPDLHQPLNVLLHHPFTLSSQELQYRLLVRGRDRRRRTGD